MSEAARRAAEHAARTSFGRLVAMLASRTGDIAGAEDALSDALVAALARWPVSGVPDKPDAWLLTAARRNLGHRRERVATAAANEATLMLLDDERGAERPIPFGDDRLKLMYVCTHPAIARDVQAPLMLQTVLGLDAARIGEVFLVSGYAMGRQLSRAKTKIQLAGVAFAVPPPETLAERTTAVLDAIYAAFGAGWDDVLGTGARTRGLAEEAIWLGRLVTELMPGDPEAMGLLALMLHCEARRVARRAPDGSFVPLDRQDVGLWNHAMFAEAESLLRAASLHGKPGRFGLEAAIQSLHGQARLTGEDLRRPLLDLYDLLMLHAPSNGAAVARAVALADLHFLEDARAQLNALSGCDAYQPWWVARAHLERLAGNSDAARDAAHRAAELTDDPAVAAFILR